MRRLLVLGLQHHQGIQFLPLEPAPIWLWVGHHWFQSREAAWPAAYTSASPSLGLVLPYEGNSGLIRANLDPCLPLHAWWLWPGAETPCGTHHPLQLQPLSFRQCQACWPLAPGLSRALEPGGAWLPAYSSAWGMGMQRVLPCSTGWGGSMQGNVLPAHGLIAGCRDGILGPWSAPAVMALVTAGLGQVSATMVFVPAYLDY